MPDYGKGLLDPSRSLNTRRENAVVKPIRILQVVGSLRKAGMETWLVRVLRKIDRDRFAIDFLIEEEDANGWEPDVRKLGSRVIFCAGFSEPWRFLGTFTAALRRHGPYDIVHAHNNYHAGISLPAAAANGVPVRIAHSHSTIVPNGPFEATYQRLMKESIRWFATEGLAVSRASAGAFFGPDRIRAPRRQVLYCGIDLDAFDLPVEEAAVKTELGLPIDSLVIGHVGRFQNEKNHLFLLDVAASAMASDATAWLLLIGDGPTRSSVEAHCCKLGIRGRVLFAGVRRDVPRLLRAMNVFVFPSLFEGLGLACIEAQAAGLAVVASDGLPVELNAIPELFQTLSLSAPPHTWAAAALSAAKRSRTVSGCKRLRGTPFDIEVSAARLSRIYSDAAQFPLHGIKHSKVSR
jgi:glycosyltransferase involved in cell wall biosynthesis